MSAQSSNLDQKTQATDSFYGSSKFMVQLADDRESLKKKCEAGKQATVEYTGKLAATGKVFDTTKGVGPF